MDPNEFPTKGNLILAKNSLGLAKQGHELMDKKRNILIREMMALIDRVASEGIPAVDTIELSTRAVAKTVAEETGVEILTLHSMQTVTQDEFQAGESYVSLMGRNLEALQRGLE